MKITNLLISNFRGIREVNLQNLGVMVIIAGQNGSGKSCIFDAIRLLKSVYGGYQANEWQHWMTEFQIAITNKSSDFQPMLNDKTRDMVISCDFKLAQEERIYLQQNAVELLKEWVWRIELPEAFSWGSSRMAVFANQFRDKEPAVTARAQGMVPEFLQQLASDTITGRAFIPVGGQLTVQNASVLNVLFSTFLPSEVGVIDYHGPQRHYTRENVQGINLNLEALDQQKSQTALYNSNAKYNNVKSEMAASYVKEMFAEKAGVQPTIQASLSLTLKDLFSSFFPDKTFEGPKATEVGTLRFPVTTSNGRSHDLDDLSSGEKEILYGYLRIRNSAPKNSIIMIDEPELHLNPRLIRGLPQFYRKNLGVALHNQLWLVSHSDALLREVVGKENYNVYHMSPSGMVGIKEPQIRPLTANADLDLALVDLVGDLSAYKPSGKVIIFEGGGDSEFDRRVVGALFPKLNERSNMISGANKTRVRALHETLQSAANEGVLPFTFYAITDRDSEPLELQSEKVNLFSWDVYHIENYFLVPVYIQQVMKALGVSNVLSEEDMLDELRACAKETMPQLIRHELSEYANQVLVGSINMGTDPKKGDLSAELFAAVERSSSKIKKNVDEKLSFDAIRSKEAEMKTSLEGSLASGLWISNFRGRDILKRFAGKWANSIPYEAFRNLILSRMQDDGFQPLGMKHVVDKILGDQPSA